MKDTDITHAQIDLAFVAADNQWRWKVESIAFGCAGFAPTITQAAFDACYRLQQLAKTDSQPPPPPPPKEQRHD